MRWKREGKFTHWRMYTFASAFEDGKGVRKVNVKKEKEYEKKI